MTEEDKFVFTFTLGVVGVYILHVAKRTYRSPTTELVLFLYCTSVDIGDAARGNGGLLLEPLRLIPRSLHDSMASCDT